MSKKIPLGNVCDTWDYDSKSCALELTVYKLEGKTGSFYVSDLQIDLDGSPQAYHPRDRKKPDNHTRAYDWLTSVKVSDLQGIQGEDAIGPMPGYYVSATSYQDLSIKNVKNAARYVDAGAIPYIVLPGGLPQASGEPKYRGGEAAIVADLKTGNWTPAIYADAGRAVGEVSLKTALNLGFDPRKSKYPPKVLGGIDQKRFFYLVFPGSKVSFPLSEKKVREVALPLFEAWGGMEQVKELFRVKFVPPGITEDSSLARHSASAKKRGAKKAAKKAGPMTLAAAASAVAPGARSMAELLSSGFRPAASAALEVLSRAPKQFKELRLSAEDYALRLPDLVAKYPKLPSRDEARAAIFSLRKREGAPVILAEGDSWFDFPFPLFDSARSDVLDALASVQGYAVVREARRGDVVSNMCQPANIQRFVELAKRHKPKAFLFSGGGNDFVGGDPRKNSKLFQFIRPKGSNKPPLDAEAVRRFSRELVAYMEGFVNAMSQLNIPTILHGYANAIPDGRPAFWKVSGPWLKPTTDARDYKRPWEARQIITDFLSIYNEELESLATRRPHEVHYVDCRPHIRDSEWHDELHLLGDGFEKVSSLFDAVIKSL